MKMNVYKINQGLFLGQNLYCAKNQEHCSLLLLWEVFQTSLKIGAKLSTGKEVKEGGVTNIQKFSAGAVDSLEIKKEEQENRDDMQIKKQEQKG